jgi:hypothetical protein
MSIDSRDQPPPPEPLREVTESDHDRTDTSKRDEGQSLVEANRQPFDSQGRPTDIDDPAGRWEVGPLRTRGQEYEGWSREETGAPQGMEYHVTNEIGNRWLDTRYVEDRNGEPTEVLVDAKDDYAQFIDPETGDWKDWWTGLDGALGQAQDQVDVADGRPVEWWCSQPEVAERFTEAFESDFNLNGKITAVHRPMPERDI